MTFFVMQSYQPALMEYQLTTMSYQPALMTYQPTTMSYQLVYIDDIPAHNDELPASIGEVLTHNDELSAGINEVPIHNNELSDNSKEVPVSIMAIGPTKGKSIQCDLPSEVETVIEKPIMYDASCQTDSYVTHDELAEDVAKEPENLCEGNPDAKFHPLILKHQGVFTQIFKVIVSYQ